MSDDLDLDMEVVEDDELDELDAEGMSGSGTEEKLVDDNAPGPGKEVSTLTSDANTVQDWQRVPLEVVSDITMGSSPKSEFYNESGEGPPFLQANNEFGYRSPTADRWCSEPTKRCEKGDLLMTIRGTYVGQMNLADDDYCIGRGLAAIAPGEDLNGEYLFHYLDYIEPYVKSIAAGSTFDSVSSGDIESLEVEVPPLPEQRKIASVLSAVDQAIQKTEAIIEQAKRVKRGLMQKLFREGLRGGTQKEVRRIGQIPSEWEVVQLGDVCDQITDGTHQSPETKEEGFPYITSQNIRDWGFDLSDMKYISKEAHEKITSRCSPQKGDVLYVKDGANTGTVQVNTLGFEFSLLSSVALIRTITDILDPLYLKHLLSWPKFRQLMMSRMSGTGISRLTISKIEKSEIILPPIEEQQRISDILNTFDDTVTKEDKRLKTLKRLKRGLMQDLLTGKVRTADRAIDVLDEVEAHG